MKSIEVECLKFIQDAFFGLTAIYGLLDPTSKEFLEWLHWTPLLYYGRWGLVNNVWESLSYGYIS